jgi:hypothetical protein
MNIHMELQSTCLLSLLLGERRQPTWNGGIDTGYTPQKVIPKSRPQIPALENMSTSENTSTFSSQADPVYTTIEEDDIFLFNYDKARLMVLVKHMFHESYSAHGERGAKNSDPVQYYNDIMSYVFGNTVIDMNAANDAITNFKVNRNNKFATECVRWERLFEDYQYARNGVALEEDRKRGFLMKHVYTVSS